MYTTRDLHLISYLDMLGFTYTIQKVGEEGTAHFEDPDGKIKAAVRDYFNDIGRFQSFASRIRNVKSRIRNSF